MSKWNAKEYSKSSSAQEKWANELIAKLSFKGNERILDIGCGDGKSTAAIAKYLEQGSILGIDSSPEMIKFAKENFPRVEFIVCDASKLIFENEFDVIFSNATLHWVIDHSPVLSGIKKALKTSGRVLLQMGGRGNAASILDVGNIMIKEGRWAQYFNGFSFPYGFYGAEEYEVWLKKVGLKAKRIEMIPKDMTQNGIDGLSGWIRTTWLPYLERIPQELREEFIEELASRYIKNNPTDEKGLVHVGMVRLEVEAVA